MPDWREHPDLSEYIAYVFVGVIFEMGRQSHWERIKG